MMKILVVLLLFAGLLRAAAGFACGQSRTIFTSRISNGQKAEEGEWPWHGAMFSRSRHDAPHRYRCGSTLIGPRMVLTAAHCTVPNGIAVSPDNVLLKFGLINREQPGPHAKSYQVKKILRHERYDPKTLQQDIALLKTVDEVDFTEFIWPICLPSVVHKEIPISGHIIGWGLNKDDRLENTLNHASVPVVNYTTCLRSNPMHFATVLARGGESNFCIGGQNNINACQGDSGGGFFQFQEQSWYIQGIISTGDPTNHRQCDATQYVTATNVSFFREWINKVQNGWKNNLLDLEDCGTDNHDISVPEKEKPTYLQYPWITIEQFTFAGARKPQAMCGGVLIHPRFVLIAGHCVCEACSKINLDSVHLGDYNLSTDPDTEYLFGEPTPTYTQSITVEKVIRYPTSARNRYENDIALLKLSHPAKLNVLNVRPICIPTVVEDFRRTPLMVTGWKRVGEMASVVQRESVRLVDNQRCEEQYTQIKVDLGSPDSFLCVARYEEATNCANFLSGTPLQYVRQDLDGVNRYYLGGLFAFGLSRCNHDFTDVYVNVSYYGRWIRDVVDSESGSK